jgi:rod shape-determining protein MreC
MLDIRRRTGYLFLAVTLGHVILISAQVQTKSGGRVLESVLFSAFSQLQRATGSMTGAVGNLWNNYFVLRGIRQENESLRQQVADLQIRLQQERALAQRSARFRQLLGLKEQVPLPTTAAEVIGAATSPGVQTLIINKGSADGIRTDNAVIAAAGIVGRVLDTSRHTASVQLIISRTAAAGAMIERSRAGGVVVGGGDNPPLEMEYVSNLADVKAGDMVVTAGVDGIYPKGLPIGRVESVQRGAGMYTRIRVRPVVDFSNVEEVLVVVVQPAAEPEQTGTGRQP